MAKTLNTGRIKPIQQAKVLAVTAVLIMTAGCHLRPNFGPPGTIGMQRSRAVLHDPYPSDDLGPPVLGGRPRGFDRPQSEARNLQEVRSALFSTSTNQVPAYPQNYVPTQPSY